MKLPTDLQLLETIYNRYFPDFEKNEGRDSKIYVPINVDEIGKALGVDGEIVFGRLYYHLNNKFSYKNDNGSKVEFFSIKVGRDSHCVQFPYLSAVLADLKYENKKYKRATFFSIASLILSIISLSISLFVKFH